MQEIPPAKPTDAEDVAWGLQTAASLWKRGERSDAVAWLRRAAQAASDAQDDDRALELARLAAELADYVGQQGTMMPGASPAAIEENTSLDAVPPAAQPAPPAQDEVVSSRAPSVPPADKVHAGMFDPWSEPPPPGSNAPAFPPPPPPAIMNIPAAPHTQPMFGEDEVVTSAKTQQVPPQALPSRPAPPPSGSMQTTPPQAAAPTPSAPPRPAAPAAPKAPGKPPPLPPAGSRKPPPLPPRALAKKPPTPPSAPQQAAAPRAPSPPAPPVVPAAPITAPLLPGVQDVPPPPAFIGQQVDVPPPPAFVAQPDFASSAPAPEAPRFPTPMPPRAMTPMPPRPVTPVPPSGPTAQTDVPSLYPAAPPRDDRDEDADSSAQTTPPPPMQPRFDQLDEPDDMAPTPLAPPVAVRAATPRPPTPAPPPPDDSYAAEPPADLTPTPPPAYAEEQPLPSFGDQADVAPPPEPAPEPEAPPPAEPVAAAPTLDLENVDAFSDLPDDARAEFAAAGVVHVLAEGDEVAGFALAYVIEGTLDVAATMVDAAAVRLPEGAVLRSRGTTNEGVPMRIIALPPRAVVATWSGDAVEKAFANTPWVEEDLRAASDRVMTLVGITIGPLGERLDQSIREEIVGRLQVKPLIPGEIVVNKGEPVPGLLLVGVGEIELVDGDDIKGVVGSGDFLFATEVLGAGAAPYTARAGAGGALAMFGNRSIAQELMVTCPPLLEVFAGM